MSAKSIPFSHFPLADGCVQRAVNYVRWAVERRYPFETYEMQLWCFLNAMRWMSKAIAASNREGYPPRERAPLFRMRNWLRAELRKMEKSI